METQIDVTYFITSILCKFSANDVAPPQSSKCQALSLLYGHGGHLGHVTWTIYINFGFPFPMRFIYNLTLIDQAVSEEKMFEIVDDDDS